MKEVFEEIFRDPFIFWVVGVTFFIIGGIVGLSFFIQ
jgi:hypothetical protein